LKHVFLLTWAEALSNPLEVPSDSGKVISAANSKPTGRYPVMKNLNNFVFSSFFLVLKAKFWISHPREHAVT